MASVACRIVNILRQKHSNSAGLRFLQHLNLLSIRMRDTPADLPDDVAALQAIYRLAEREIVDLRDRDQSARLPDEKLKHQLAGLRRHRFGQRSEALDQLELALEEEEIARAAAPQSDDEDAASEPVGEPKRKPRRKPLPDHLHRNDEILSPGSECSECGGSLRTLGEDVTEELEYVPGRFVVNRIIRPRMACSCCDAICQSSLPSRPIEKGRPGPGLLAHVLVNKYADHLPLYRQSQIFEREGIDLDRSTLADWIGKSAALLEPLAKAVERHVLGGQAIFADDTPLKLLSPVRVKPRPRGSGLMSGMNGHGRVKCPRRHSIAFRVTARANSRLSISRIIPAGCMRTDIPGSMNLCGRPLHCKEKLPYLPPRSGAVMCPAC